MRLTTVRRPSRLVVGVAALLLVAGTGSQVAASGGGAIPLPGPHDQAAAERAGREAGPAPNGPVYARSTQNGTATAAAIPGPSGPGAQPQVPWATARVYSTSYNTNTACSVEVAVLDKCVKFAALGNTSAFSSIYCVSSTPLGQTKRVLTIRDFGRLRSTH